MRTLVCAIAKNENHYLREWVEYYKDLGFTNICIYDNNDIDGEHFDEVIDDYIQSGFVIVKNRRGMKGSINWAGHYYDDKNWTCRSIQIESYDDCYHTIANDYDWMLLVDIDEFLTFDDCNLVSMLSNPIYQNYQFIAFSVIVYGDSDIIETNGDYSIRKFTKLAVGDSPKFIKPIIRTRMHACHINSAHGFEWEKLWQNYNDEFIQGCLTTGQPLVKGAIRLHEYEYSKAYIKHYTTKTLEEWIDNKMNKGWPDNFNQYRQMDLDYFFGFNKLTQSKLDYLHLKGIDYDSNASLCNC